MDRDQFALEQRIARVIGGQMSEAQAVTSLVNREMRSGADRSMRTMHIERFADLLHAGLEDRRGPAISQEERNRIAEQHVAINSQVASQHAQMNREQERQQDRGMD